MITADPNMYNFLCGAVMMACGVAGLFFFRFWVQTQDNFFRIFAWAFWVLGVERLIPLIWHLQDEPRTFVYIVRLAAFSLILIAIYLKNKSSRPHP